MNSSTSSSSATRSTFARSGRASATSPKSAYSMQVYDARMANSLLAARFPLSLCSGRVDRWVDGGGREVGMGDGGREELKMDLGG